MGKDIKIGDVWERPMCSDVEIKYVSAQNVIMKPDGSQEEFYSVEQLIYKWLLKERDGKPVEKPCPFGVGDVVVGDSGRDYIFINNSSKKGFISLYQFMNETICTDYPCENFTLLYTAEQLDDEANYVVVESYLDEIKEAHAEGKDIQFRRRYQGPKADWHYSPDPTWLDSNEYRVKPETTYGNTGLDDIKPTKPEMPGLYFKELVEQSESLKLKDVECWISRIANSINFSGYYYKLARMEVVTGSPVIWTDKRRNHWSHQRSTDLNIPIRPTHAAFTQYGRPAVAI